MDPRPPSPNPGTGLHACVCPLSSALGLAAGLSCGELQSAHACAFHTCGEGWVAGGQPGAQGASGAGSRGRDRTGTESRGVFWEHGQGRRLDLEQAGGGEGGTEGSVWAEVIAGAWPGAAGKAGRKERPFRQPAHPGSWGSIRQTKRQDQMATRQE